MVDIAYLMPGAGLDVVDADRRDRIRTEMDRREGIANELTPAHVDVTVEKAIGPGPSSIESAVEEEWCTVGLMKGAWRIRDDYDAIVIGCFGDPGIDALRELVEVPVVGPAETTIRTAAQIADRFTWLTILEELETASWKQAHEHHLAQKCTSVRSVDAPVLEIDHEDNALVERMIETGKTAVEEDGAQALFPGCMSLSFMQVHDEIQGRVGVPFLDPATLALEQADTWARHGVAQSKDAYPSPKLEKLDMLLGDAKPAPADD
ncbi:MAG: aspartate/glutamate racemase family protein [Halobacteriales archaeon]